jgi:hypothetical protein
MNDWVQQTNIMGPVGAQGPPGSGLEFKGTVANEAALPVGAADGDAWQTLDTGTIFVWDAAGNIWIEGAPLIGPQGPQGNPGAASTVPGPAGPGVAAGGAAGQVLSKINATDYNTQWTTPVSDWSNLTGKPATFPPTLPIAQSGVTNLVSDLAAKSPLAAVSTSAPGSPVTGQFWWNSTTKVLSIWTGAAWEQVLATWA